MYDYTSRFELSAEGARIHEEDRKQELSTLEKFGLEKVLADFIEDYEQETFGEVYTHIEDVTRYNKSGVDILDGVHDTYVFDNYAIGDIWTTNNGCICITCVDLDNYIGDDKEEFEMHRENFWGLLDHFDIWSDFAEVVFKLN